MFTLTLQVENETLEFLINDKNKTSLVKIVENINTRSLFITIKLKENNILIKKRLTNNKNVNGKRINKTYVVEKLSAHPVT